MSAALAIIPLPTLPVPVVPALVGLSDADILASAMSPSTRLAYASDARIFCDWCAFECLDSMPALPETIAKFLLAQARAGIRASTLTRRVAAIRSLHKLAGLEPPTNTELVKRTMAGIRRTIGSAKVKKRAAVADLIRVMVDLCPDTLAGKRDRAMLALGFAMACRRSELVALDVEDLEERPDGFKVLIRRSKTDQEGVGQIVHVLRGTRIRPVDAVNDWLEASSITEGPLFRRLPRGKKLGDRLVPEFVADLVKSYAEKAGEDPALFAGHSLRSGFLTSAAEATNANIFKMRAVSRHKSLETLGGYVQEADGFRDHAGAGFL